MYACLHSACPDPAFPNIHCPSPLVSSQVDIVVFGGQNIADSGAPRPGLQASPWSQQMSVIDNYDGTYSYSPKWNVEYMGLPRVMGDATLLPNGKMVLLNGATVSMLKGSGSIGCDQASRTSSCRKRECCWQCWRQSMPLCTIAC